MSPFRTKQRCPWIYQLLFFISIAIELASTTTTSTASLDISFPPIQTAKSDAECNYIVPFNKSYSLGYMPQSREAAPVVFAPSDAGACPLRRNLKFAGISGAVCGLFLPLSIRATLELGAVGAILGAVKVHAAHNVIIAHNERRSRALLSQSPLPEYTAGSFRCNSFCLALSKRLYCLSSDIREISCFLTFGYWRCLPFIFRQR